MGNLHHRRRKQRKHARRLADDAWRLADSDLPAAEKRIRNALKVNDGDCVLWSDLGLILWKQERPREAESAFRTSIRLRPEYVDAKTNLAALLAARGFFRQAARILEEIPDTAPQAELIRGEARKYREAAESATSTERDD